MNARKPLTKADIPVALLAVLVLAMLFAVAAVVPGQTVPSCAEDEIVMGAGGYHGDSGTWDTYECVHPDALAPAAPAARTYCVGNVRITVLEAGKRAQSTTC